MLSYHAEKSCVFDHKRLQKLTLTAIPPKAPCHISGLNGSFLASLQQNKQPLQLVWNTGDWILLRVLKLPAEVEQL